MRGVIDEQEIGGAVSERDSTSGRKATPRGTAGRGPTGGGPTGGGTATRPAKAKATAKAAETPLTKAEKRAAAKVAARRAAEAKRRRELLLKVLAAVVATALIGGVYFAMRDDDPGGSGDATGSASASPAADPALRTKPATSAGSGELTKLVVTPIIEGKGPAAQNGQTITVNYVGVSYKTGAEFDASWKRSEPFTFQLGTGGVIKGWDQGLVGVKVGSRVQLDIPADLAYGDNPGGNGPSGPLRFVVDVLDAK